VQDEEKQNTENATKDQPEQEQTAAPAGEPSESSIEEKLASAERKAAEMQDAFLRAKAEGENIRRRAQEDISKAHKFAIEGFAESMVSVKDSLEMALKVEAPSVESIKEGVEVTLRQLTTAFEKNRLLEISPDPGGKAGSNEASGHIDGTCRTGSQHSRYRSTKGLHDCGQVAAARACGCCSSKIFLKLAKTAQYREQD